MKDLNLEQQIYLCKYHEVDNCLHLGITAEERESILKRLKENGLYNQYRMLSEDEYEHIITQEKKGDKYSKILDKYKFNKTKRAYKNLKEVLKVCDKYKGTEINIKNTYKKIAQEQNVETYIINNDCIRILDEAYQEHEELFKQNKYDKKPTIREFVLKELNKELPNMKNIDTNKKAQRKTCKNTEISAKNDINSQFIADIDNTYVKVSVRTVAEWAYQKRIFRQNVRGK